MILVIPLLFVRKIYEAMGQDDEVADYAALYVYFTLPSVYFFFISRIYTDFASQQEVTHYGMWGMIASTVMHAISILVLYVWLDYGFHAIVISTGIMFFVRFCVSYSLVNYAGDIQRYDDVRLFSRESCTNVLPLLRKSLASLALGVWGWWSFDIFTLMSTYISTVAAGAQTIMRSIGLLTFMIPVGFALGSGILMGKSIGQKNTELVLQYYKIGMIAALAISAIQITFLWSLRDQIISMFTSNEEVAAEISNAWPVLLIFTLFDATQIVSAGFIKSTGK